MTKILNRIVSEELKKLLLEMYINSILKIKQQYYNLENEFDSSFDEGWGYPIDLSWNEYKILQIFKYCKGYEELELELFYQQRLYEEVGIDASI